MGRLFLICLRYYDDVGENLTVGGMQTYITNLSAMAKEQNWEPVVIQLAGRDFKRSFPYGEVIGVDVSKAKSLQKKRRLLFDRCMQEYTAADGVIFATERLVVKNGIPNTVAIQHGISWDVESVKPCSRFANIVKLFTRTYRAIGLTNEARLSKHLVCVDYNYVNWYRTQIKHAEMKYTVIPNFSKVAELQSKPDPNTGIRIIFARRFQPFRGTRLFAAVAKKILEKYNMVHVTFAGEGPDETFLREQFAGMDEQVSFIRYQSEEALAVHADKHIAVVPTLGSEGTSLSLLEAMSAQCAVVCTNVGGMTNIVLDGYNGLMVNPEETALYQAIVSLIEDEALRDRLAQRGYETVKNAFSYEAWRSKWTQVLSDLRSK